MEVEHFEHGKLDLQKPMALEVYHLSTTCLWKDGEELPLLTEGGDDGSKYACYAKASRSALFHVYSEPVAGRCCMSARALPAC